MKCQEYQDNWDRWKCLRGCSSPVTQGKFESDIVPLCAQLKFIHSGQIAGYAADKQHMWQTTCVIGADLPGAVGADAPIDGRSMGALHP